MHLVTGGAGFIGSHLTESLLAAGHHVTVLDDLSTGQRENLKSLEPNPKLTFRLGSITDPVLLAEVVHDVDVIYHLAAAVGVKLVANDPLRTIETNIYPTESLLRLAVQGGGKLFFLASTSEVFGRNPKERWTEEDDLHLGPTSRPRWAYGCSKAIDEFLALAYYRQYGLPVVIARFFNVVGPRQVGDYGMVIPRFVDQALNGGPVVVYDDGEQVRCFAHVREVVEAIMKLMGNPAALGKVFNVGGDEPWSIRDVAEAVIERVNPAVRIEYLPYSKAYGDDFEDVRRRVPDVSRLEQTIGSKPRLGLEAILDEIIAWKRQASGHVAAAPPRRLMESRRLITSSKGVGHQQRVQSPLIAARFLTIGTGLQNENCGDLVGEPPGPLWVNAGRRVRRPLAFNGVSTGSRTRAEPRSQKAEIIPAAKTASILLPPRPLEGRSREAS